MAKSTPEQKMFKILLPVDGSACAIRATQTLLDRLAWYKQHPQIDLLAVHLPVPRMRGMSAVVSKEMLERYYTEECEEMLAPSRKLLESAGVKYTAHTIVGPIAEGIIEQATQSGSDVIYMGTRGMTALANMVLGSVATRVLHLAHIPVVLIH
jgi:nucleotide-binding universal stress UspA family protein